MLLKIHRKEPRNPVLPVAIWAPCHFLLFLYSCRRRMIDWSSHQLSRFLHLLFPAKWAPFLGSSVVVTLRHIGINRSAHDTKQHKEKSRRRRCAPFVFFHCLCKQKTRNEVRPTPLYPIRLSFNLRLLFFSSLVISPNLCDSLSPLLSFVFAVSIFLLILLFFQPHVVSNHAYLRHNFWIRNNIDLSRCTGP